MTTMKIVKSLMLTGLLGGALVCTSGCIGDPGYSGEERSQRILRNEGYELGSAVDDFDHFMMFQPASRLTYWNVQ